jgi:hypothetical protein
MYQRVGRREGCDEAMAVLAVSEVLVEVAIIQVRAFKTIVEGRSMVTAVDHGLVDPKR